MPIRSLNGLDYSVRSLNGLSNVIDYTVSLPLTIDSDYNIKLSTLTSYGSSNQILKMNSAGTALEFTTETDTTYTVSLPLTLSTQNKIGLAGLTSYGTDNQILRMNGTTSIEWSNETDTTYTVSTPLVINNNNVISLNGISGYGGGIGQSGKRQLIRTNTNATALEYFDEPDYINSATLPLSISSSGVISLASILTLDGLNMNSTQINLKTNDTNHYVKYSYDGVEVGGYGSGNGAVFKVYSTGVDTVNNPPLFSPEVLAYYFRNYIQFQKSLWLNQTAIYFYLDTNGLDSNHYIKYVGRAGSLGCNGVQVGGYGDGNRACFEVVNTQTDPDAVLFQVCPDKVISNQKMYMTSQPIYLKQSGDNGHYIKYQSNGDCMELGSYSNLHDADPVFKFTNVFNSELLVSFNKNNNTFSKETFFTSEITALSLIVTEDITCTDIEATNIDTDTLDVELDITLGAVDKHIYFTPDLLNRIKATSTDLTGGGILITGYDTVRLSEHVNSNRYVELYNDSFTVSNCDLVMSGVYTDEFRLKGGIMDKGQWGANLGGRMSFANQKFTSANGMIQIEASRFSLSPANEFDCMSCRKGLGSHIINFVKQDNSGNMGQIRASTANNIAYDTSSDRRLKTNIIDMGSMIDKIMELRPREYNWISDNEYDYGFIAQEVHTVFPHMREDVSCYCGEDMENMDMDNPIDKDGKPIYFGIDYGSFTPYLIKSFQEFYFLQKTNIKNLQEQINKQQEQINQQQIIIDKLINSSTFANFRKLI